MTGCVVVVTTGVVVEPVVVVVGAGVVVVATGVVVVCATVVVAGADVVFPKKCHCVERQDFLTQHDNSQNRTPNGPQPDASSTKLATDHVCTIVSQH